MEQPKSPNLRRLAIFTALFILLSAALLFGATDLIRELIVLPVSYLIWVFGVLIRFLHQVYFWIIVLFFGIWVAYSTLLQTRRKNQAAPLNAPEPAEASAIRGRMHFWQTRVGYLQTERSEYFTGSFHSALWKLLLDMLAYRYRMTPKQVETQLQKGGLDLPKDIRDYVLGSLRPAEGGGDLFFRDLWEQIVSIFRNAFFDLRDALYKMTGTANRPKAAQERYSQPISFKEEALVRQILKFMEEELEVPHDDAGR